MTMILTMFKCVLSIADRRSQDFTPTEYFDGFARMKSRNGVPLEMIPSL